jgi:radical SAM superfamily enzyme YgiQ (UPF0313 family)
MRRAGFQFDLLDLDAHPRPPEQIEQFLQTNRYDVVAMGCIVTGYKHVKWLSLTIKRAFPETKIVVGNSVASSITDLLFQKTAIDIAVLGEGDVTIVELLRRLQASSDLGDVPGICYREDGRIRKNPPRQVIEDVNQIPMPDWELFDIQVYIDSLSKSVNEPLPPIPREEIRSLPVNTARGCPFKCTFCYHVFRHVKYRWRSPDSIIREMRHLHEKYGINYFAFADELTFFSIKQAEAFADALLACALPVYWYGSCRSDLFADTKELRVPLKLKESGCMSLSFSLESADPGILKWMNKKVGVEAFCRQVEILRQAGIASLTSIVIGYPSETKETIKATMDCCIANGIYPSAGYLLPQPSTPIYDYAVEHNYIQDKEEYLLAMGDRQDLRLNMTAIPDDELEAFVKDELARCNRELGLNLENGSLLKTGFYRARVNEPLPVTAEASRV